MSDTPILVLQMQRMGDLIMTFPLLGWLQRHYQGHPIWVMAEERFFTPLQSLSPSVVFFPPEAAPRMRGVRFHRIINLSHRPDAAALCGSLQTERRYGGYTRDSASYVAGYWALYRASIVHNNRYNRFHWSDLQALDHMTSHQIPCAAMPRAFNARSHRICLVVGASEPEKRPTATFWGALARSLVTRGFRPFFAGGTEDVALGADAARKAGLPAANLCGRFNLTELVNVLRDTRLCITPDTGPMHLATWVGVPVLNVSVGPVNPWETGPITTGQYIARAALSCAGCWRCHAAAPLCHKHLDPDATAALAHAIINRPAHVARLHISGMRLYTTTRTTEGLYSLLPARPAPSTAREVLSDFWQAWFLDMAPRPDDAPAAPSPLRAAQSMRTLEERFPALASRMQQAVARLGHNLVQHVSGKKNIAAEPEFWRQHPPLLRPFTGHLHLRLQNGEFSPAICHAVLRDVEQLAALCRA